MRNKSVISSPLLRKLYADGTGCRIVLSQAREPVLLGAAVAAMAPFGSGDVLAVANALEPGEDILEPDAAYRAMHEERYEAFKALY